MGIFPWERIAPQATVSERQESTENVGKTCFEGVCLRYDSCSHDMTPVMSITESL